MDKLKFQLPFKPTPEGLKYAQFLIGMTPEERREYLLKQEIQWNEEKRQLNWCKTCADAGFIYHPTQDKNDSMWGHPVVCPDCRGMQHDAKINTRKIDQTFDTWHKTAATKQAYDYSVQLATGEGKFLWLYIYGAHGCGKTHLAKSAMHKLRARNCQTAYIFASALFDDLRRSLETKTLADRVKYYQEIEYLVIDDLGTQKETDWTVEKLEQILNYRYENYAPLLITSNVPPDKMPPAIHSRFLDAERSRIVLIQSNDYRTKKEAKEKPGG